MSKKNLTSAVRTMTDFMKEKCVNNIAALKARGDINLDDNDFEKIKNMIDSTVSDCFVKTYDSIMKSVEKN